MNGNKNVVKSPGGVQKVVVEVGLDHHYIRIEEMNQSKLLVKTTENSQKVKVGLRHLKDSILVEMKRKEYVMESTGVIQKAEVGPSQQHPSNIQTDIQSMIMKNLHCLALRQDSHPHVIHVKLPQLCKQGNVKPVMID